MQAISVTEVTGTLRVGECEPPLATYAHFFIGMRYVHASDCSETINYLGTVGMPGKLIVHFIIQFA